MITFFTCPKPFAGLDAIHQRNAFYSWKTAVPEAEILAIVPDRSLIDEQASGHVQFCDGVECNEKGTPYISSIFSVAQENASNDIMAYVNADILLPPNTSEIINAFKMCRRVMFLAQRSDCNVDYLLEGAGDYRDEYNHLRRNAILAPTSAIDLMMFRRDACYQMLPFLVGRPKWDNWFLFHAVSKGVRLVDFSPMGVLLHQNHNYAHVQERTGSRWEGPEAVYNETLAQGHNLNIGDCNYQLSPRGIVRIKPDKDRIERRLELLQKYRPRFFKLLISWKLRAAFCRFFPNLIIPVA